MKVDFTNPGTFFSAGQKVHAEVVESNEHGSRVLVNGIPITTGKQLPQGKKVVGVVENVQGNQATLNLSENVSTQTDDEVGSSVLKSLNLSSDPENKIVLESLRKLGIPINAELIQKGRELLNALKIPLSQLNRDAVGLILLKNLPPSAYPLLKEYLQGGLKLGNALLMLLDSDKEKLSGIWRKGELMRKILSLSPEKIGELKAGLKEHLPEEVARNLAFQDLFSVAPKENREGNTYFQWPIFWKDQEIPDTLEGEAYFSGKDGKDAGFSLRVLVNPPNLGALEVGIHKIQKSLWVHFGAEKFSESNPIGTMLPALTTALENQGWKPVRLTIGQKSNRKIFLLPPELGGASLLREGLDVKV